MSVLRRTAAHSAGVRPGWLWRATRTELKSSPGIAANRPFIRRPYATDSNGGGLGKNSAVRIPVSLFVFLSVAAGFGGWAFGAHGKRSDTKQLMLPFLSRPQYATVAKMEKVSYLFSGRGQISCK